MTCRPVTTHPRSSRESRREWIESGLTHPDAEGDSSENYSIAIPPPNVTGVLHMGHALNNAIQDTLVRRARQQGKRTKWILGTDHAGIATQTQVEKELSRLGTSREELGREQFVARVWSWRERYGSRIIEQIKRLGSSADFQDERFTLDPAYARGGAKVFVDLYDKGYIYRDRYLVNWDPGSGSAISDLEVEDREVTDTLYYIDYPLASGSGAITVATVRPETMLADVAIAVNPRGRALQAPDRRDRGAADRRAQAEDHRRRLREDRFRHRRAEDHARPRSQRLRDRQPPRPSAPDRDRRGRPHGGRRGAGALPRPDTAEAQTAIVAELDDARADQRREEYTHTVPSQPALGQPHRAADLAAVVHAHGGARQARDRGRQARARSASIPRARARSTSTGWRTSAPGASPASCGGATRSRSGTAARRPTSARPRPMATAGSVTPTCSTPGSPARCGRSRRSAGPSRRRSCKAFYPTDAIGHRPRHHLPLGRPHGDDGHRVHRPDPLQRRLRALDHPGPGRAPDVEVARHRRSTRSI